MLVENITLILGALDLAAQVEFHSKSEDILDFTQFSGRGVKRRRQEQLLIDPKGFYRCFFKFSPMRIICMMIRSDVGAKFKWISEDGFFRSGNEAIQKLLIR